MKRNVALVGLMVVLCAGVGRAACPVLSVPEAKTVPVLDGVLAPGEWTDAATFTGLQLTNDRGFATEQTRFYLKWDRHNVYLAAVCEDANMAGIDLSKPYNDCLELFFQHPVSGNVTHWLFYASGKIDSILVDDEFGAGYVAPEGTAASGVRLNAKDWTIECRVPASSFCREGLLSSRSFRGNVGRSFNENGMRRKDGRGPEYGCFAHVSGQLFKPLDFATFVLAGKTEQPVRLTRADVGGFALAPIDGACVSIVTNDASITVAQVRNGEVLFRNRYDLPVDDSAAREAVRVAQRKIKGLAVDVYDAMTRLYPEEVYAPRAGQPRIALMAARNEREAAQLLVMSGGEAVRNVSVIMEPLCSADGGVLPPAAWTLYREDWVIAEPVGYPSTHGPGKYIDPLRPLAPFNLGAYAHEVVWAEVRTTAEMKAGVYRGRLRLEAEGLETVFVPVEVRVRDFTLPVQQSFPTAFNLWEREIYRVGFEGRDRTPEAFAEVVEHHLSMLVDHRVSPLVNKNLNLTPPAYSAVMAKHYRAMMQRCVAAGASAFYIGPEVPHSEYGQIEETAWKALWKKLADEYRAAGLLDKAYAYPFDEPGNRNAPLINRATKWMKEAAPDLKILLTGATSKMPASQFENIDIWCPASHWVNYRNKEIVQKEGVKVWWYPCSGPWYPYPNYHLDIEPGAWRIQTWMSWKWKFDGILYWAAAFWNAKDLKRNNSYSVNGDGVLVYPKDASCEPIPSVRLKIICDSMEDYEYFVLLDRLARASEKAKPEFAARAQQLLRLDNMIDAMDRYALKGEQYDRARAAIADLIELLH